MWIIKKASSFKFQASSFWILLFLIACSLWLVACSLLYAQNAKVRVPADVTAETIILNPQGSAPSNPVEGEIYYRNRHYYYGGIPLDWRSFGTSKTVATRIVAVRRDPPDEALDSDLTEKTADYICDGTADQVEIQQAIDSLGGSNGGVVYLLEGTYNISGSILLDNVAPDDSGKVIIGAGSGTVLRATAGIDVINAQNVSNILISQLRIDGNNTSSSGIVFSQYVTDSLIDKVWVENMQQRAINISTHSDNNILSNNCIEGNQVGIWIIALSNNNSIYNNNIQGTTGTSLLLSNSRCNTISGNNIEGAGPITAGGISLAGNAFGTPYGNSISGNDIRRHNEGIEIDGAYQNVISANNIQLNNIGIEVTGTNSPTYGNIISGNNIQLNSQRGIIIEASYDNNISGNIIWSNGGSSEFDGIRIRANSDNNIVSSNRIFDSSGGGYGINWSTSDCNDNYAVGNLIDGAAYIGAGYDRRITDSGTDTRYTDKVKITLERVSDSSPPIRADTSYVKLDFSGAATIDNGKAAGDILTIEGPDSGSVTISDSGNANLGANPRSLDANDTLSLIWDGSAANCCWVERGYADN